MEFEQNPSANHPDSVRPYSDNLTTRKKILYQNKDSDLQWAESLPKAPATYASEVSFLLGVVCFTIGLVGFVVDNFLSTRLGPLHSWLLLVTAIAALTFGYVGKSSVRFFCYIAGSIYLILGVAGLALGRPGATNFGSLKADTFIWTILPNQLAFGLNDHFMHLLIGAIFIAGASLKKKAPKSGVHF